MCVEKLCDARNRSIKVSKKKKWCVGGSDENGRSCGKESVAKLKSTGS